MVSCVPGTNGGMVDWAGPGWDNMSAGHSIKLEGMQGTQSQLDT